LHAAHWKTYAGTTTLAHGCINLSLGRLGFTSTTLSAATTRLRPHALYVDLAVRRDYSSPAARALRRPRRAPRLLVSGRTRSTSTSPCAATTRLRPHALYVDLAVHREYSSPLPRLQRSTSSSPRLRVPWHVARLVTRLVAPLVVDYSASPRLIVVYFAFAAPPCASARRAARHAACRATRRRLLRLAKARRQLLRLRRASECLGTSRGLSCSLSRRSSSTTPPRQGSSSTTSPSTRLRVPRHVARVVTRLVAPLVVDYSSSTTSSSPRLQVPRHVARLVTRLVAPIVVDYSASPRLIVDYFAFAAPPGASARCAARHAACRAARHRLLRLCRASGCLGTLRGSPRGLSRRSPSTTPPRQGSSSTTSSSPRLRVPRLLSRLVTRLVAPLVVDYSASPRLVVDYFVFAAPPGASARRAAWHAACRAARHRLIRLTQAHRRLLLLRRASGCLGTSRGSSRGLSRRSSSTTRRRLLRLHRASGCFGTSRGSSRRSSSTTSPHAGSSSTTPPTLCVRVPRHVVQPVTRLIVDYSVRRDFVLRSHWLYFSHIVPGDYLSRGNTSSTSSTPRAATTSSSPVASRRPFISTSFPN
jgi:hypothetical protein